MNTIFYIAKRYVFAKHTQNIINIINIISAVVLVIGTAALFIILAGFQGLKENSILLVNNLNSDLLIQPKKGKFFELSTEKALKLQALNGIEYFSKTAEEKAFLQYKDHTYIAIIKGVDTSYKRVTNIKEYVISGHWNTKGYYAVIGNTVAQKLEVAIFDEENIMKVKVPKRINDNKKQLLPSYTNVPYNQLYMSVSGIFSIDEDVDKKYMYINLQNAQKLLDLSPQEISYINIKLSEKTNIEEIKKKISVLFGDKFLIKDRVEQSASLYKMLNIENLAIYLIFSLVLIVALFNLAGAINMMIIEKKKDLQTLVFLGMRIQQIRAVFLLQGLIIVFSSTLLGLALGILFCLTQIQFQFMMITYSQPYPMIIRWQDIINVLFIMGVLGTFICWIISRKINKKILE